MPTIAPKLFNNPPVWFAPFLHPLQLPYVYLTKLWNITIVNRYPLVN